MLCARYTDIVDEVEAHPDGRKLELCVPYTAVLAEMSSTKSVRP